MTDWRVALLRNLGYKPTPANLRFLSSWQRWEGGHTNNDARFNWLNTTILIFLTPVLMFVVPNGFLPILPIQNALLARWFV